jgi:hypothetical protein
VVWGGGGVAPARARQREGALVVAWTDAPVAALESEGIPFRPVDEVLGPEGLAAAEGAARTWARVWGRLPLADGRSFRELVEWRGSSLLWSATAFLLEETAGPRCARTAEAALRLLEATAAVEVDASGLDPADALLLSRACTERGVLFHGRVGGAGRPLPVARPAVRSGLGRLLSDARAPATAPAPPPPLAGAGSGAAPILALIGLEEERDLIESLLRCVSDELGRPIVAVSLGDLPRWETRRARRAIEEADAILRERQARLLGTPGLAASYAHRGVSFSDLAAGDLEALLRGALPAAARRIEAARELLAAARPAAVLVAVDGRDERRSLLHACAADGFGGVVVRRGAPGGPERADGGPRPVALCDWEPDPVAEALREAARGRVGAG